MNIIGTQIRNLKILSEIGEGGMGVVFLATHVILGKKFAVKCLTPDLSNSLQFRERFEKEAMAQASLEHPNIVQVNDFFEHENRYFLVMEYVDGRSLDEMIDHGGKLSEKNSLPILKDILAGVNFAHSQGIIHRDIKPSNILIDKSGRAKIMDFGIAIRAGDNHRLTKTGVDIGTAWYVSPEQVINPKGVDHRSDVYSIGVVLFEMLTGQAPFDGETDYTIKDKHVRETPSAVSAINHDVSDEMSGIVMKALEKSPDDRFNGCGDFLEYVEAYDQQAYRDETSPDSNILEEDKTSEPPVRHAPPEPIFNDPITGMQFVYVQGGKFMMGETHDGENQPISRGQEVEVSGFYMGRSPVTCSQWKCIMGVDPSALAKGENYPVEMVSWEDAQVFIEKLIKENNREYHFRLPTEVEWEYAARSGGKAEKYAGGGDIDATAWYDQNSGNTTRPVGSKAPNGLGLQDMSGNVWEWCSDWFKEVSPEENINPSGSAVGTQKLLRGGAWNSTKQHCQTTFRNQNWPEYKDHSWGVRLVLDMAPLEPLVSLTITSSPKGAAIWINGHDTGKKTDATIEVPPGKHKVELFMAGMQSSARNVEVISGSPAEFTFQLREMPVSVPPGKKGHALLIKAAIAAAVCFIGVIFTLLVYNSDTKKSHLRPLEATVKTQEVSRAAVKAPQIRQADKPEKISGPKKTLRGSLFVDTEPQNAQIRFLNTPQHFNQGIQLEPGRYHLEATHEGCKTQDLWINLEAGKRKNVRIRLPWVIGQLFIETEPENAQVRLLSVDQEFKQGMILKSGRYDLQISHEGYRTQKVLVDLTPGEKNRFRVKLESIMCQLFVEAEPRSARVRILNVKQKFRQGMVLEPGRYHVEVSRKGYNTNKSWVTLKEGKKRVLLIDLEAKSPKNKNVAIPNRDTAPPLPQAAYKANEGKPNNKITTNNYGHIWDPRTGLEWIVGPDEPTSFSEAKKWLNNENRKYSGLGLWRIPTNSEFQTICNQWKKLPKLFKTTGLYAWSYKGPDSDEVWVYNLKNGNAVSYKYISDSYKRVFAVRSRKD